VSLTDSEPMIQRLKKSGEASCYLYSLIFSNAFDSLKAIYPDTDPSGALFFTWHLRQVNSRRVVLSMENQGTTLLS